MFSIQSLFKPSFQRQISSSIRHYSTPVQYFKRPDSRKTYLINRYKYITAKSEILLFAHHNNLLKNEMNSVRDEIKNIGGELTVLRNSLFKSFLRNEGEEEPASLQSYFKNKGKKTVFDKLLSGPTCIISFEQTNPEQVRKLIKVLKKNDKLFIIGARIEDKLFDLVKLDQFKDLATKEQLQSELVGLLTLSSGLSLVQTLEAASKTLYLTLDTHKKNVAGELEEK